MERLCDVSSDSRDVISELYFGWLPALFETIRMEFGFWVRLKGDVGEWVRECSLVRTGLGRMVVFGGERVLSLSRTRALIVGILFSCDCDCGFESAVGWEPGWEDGEVVEC